MKRAFFFLTVFLGAVAVTAAHKLPRTLIFSQGQLKYSLQYGEYFTHWVDWPLFMDSSLIDPGDPKHGLKYRDFKKIQEIVKLYDLDGMATWQAHTRFGWVADIVGYMGRSKVPEFALLPIVSGTFSPEKDSAMLYASPRILELEGKKVFLLHGFRNLAANRKTRGELEKRYPDRSLFIGTDVKDWNMLYRFRAKGELSEADARTIRDKVRTHLREYDGFGWDDQCTTIHLEKDKRRFAHEFHDAIMRETAKVFAEPEFKGKLFLGEAVVGHENPSALGHILSSDGTRTLRSGIDIALKHGADIINIPEWDEQNENTSLRPTVFNSLAHMRIMRYYMKKLKGEKSYSLPGDDPATPNLIVSLRKILTLGERLEIELLNVPDSEKKSRYTVEVTLKNLDGKVLHRFDAQTFEADKLQEHRLEFPSEKLAAERVILPEIRVTSHGKTQLFAEGLWAPQIQSTWNFDYKWVKQPLRDLAKKIKVDFAGIAPREKGLYSVRGSIRSDENVQFAEVLDNGDCVYSVSDPAKFPFRDNEQNYAFKINLQSVVFTKFSGSFSLENAPGAVFSRHAPGNRIEYKNEPADIWHRGFYLTIPRKEAGQAVFVIDFADKARQRIPVRDVLARKGVVFGGPDGFNVAINRQLRMWKHPEPLRRRTVDFTAEIAPDQQVSVLQLQVVTPSGKLYRSRPVLTAPVAKKTVPVTVYSETLEAPVTVQVPENSVPDLRYSFDASRGLIADGSPDRVLWGMRGGYVDLASFRGCGGDQSGDGTPPNHALAQKFWKNSGDLAPEIVGPKTLRFSGKGAHVALPQGVVPRRAGFVISLDVKPDAVDRKQVILANRRAYPGALREVAIDKGTLHVNYVNHKLHEFKCDTHLALKPGAWQRIVIRYDLKNLVVSVDGKEGKILHAPGPGLYDMPTTIGSWGDAHFAGEMRNLRIRHSVE